MNNYHFFIEDNIWFLRDLNREQPASIFDHPYTAMLKRLHEKFGMKVQLDIFIETEGFSLEDMTDKYKAEWQANADWLCFGFHARTEFPEDPYLNATYDEVYKDGDYPVAVVVVRNEFMEEHPDLVNEFLARHEEVTAYMQENVLKIPDMRPSQELI